MAEYLANEAAEVTLNSPIIFNASIPCRKGYIYHEDGTGIFILRGITNQCFATYQATYNGNIAIPEGGTAGPIAIALTVNGEERATSKAIFTPAAVETFGNVTSTAIIRVPRGCCFTVAVEPVPGTTDGTPAPVITVQNSNLVITRIS